MAEILFYTREQCPLCVKAKEALRDLQKQIKLEINEIDIHTSDDLIERFGLMIPVVEYKGEIIQFGQIHIEELRKRLQKKT